MLDRKLHIMQIIYDLGIGGAQEMVRTLVDGLVASDCEVVVCTFRDGPVRKSIEELGVKVVVLPGRRRSVFAFPLFVLESVQIWRRLAVLVRENRIDLIQTHLLRALDFVVLLLRPVTPLRAVLVTMHCASLNLHERELPPYQKWLLIPKRYGHRLLGRMVSPWVSGYVAVSDEVRESTLNYVQPLPGKITVINNGVDTKRYGKPVDRDGVRRSLGLGVNSHLIAQVGTLKEQKGHCYLVEALASIVPQHPNVHALFIGDGELRVELQDLVRTLGLQENIHFLGNRGDVPELLAASDLFVLPSLWEGLSIALLEAMATGLPIIASVVSGTVQAIEAGETGVLVPPGNSRELALAITNILGDPEGARTMGARAKIRAEREFSARKQAEEHKDLYLRLLQRGEPAGSLPYRQTQS